MYALTLLIPILAVLVLFRLLDLFVLINKRILIASCLYGIILSVLLHFFQALFPIPFEGKEIVLLYIQEFLKALFIYGLLRTGRTNFMLDTAAYAAAIGLGFCMAQIILQQNAESMITSLWITKAFGIYFAQTLSVVITALIMLWLKSKSLLRFFPIAPIPALFLLAFSNKIDALTSLFLLFSFSLIAFKWIADFEAYKISKKMDTELSSELATLQAIRSGVFSDTSVGSYLLTLRASFAPEVYWDMICCVRLSLEISVWRKSDRLLKMVDLPPIHSQDIIDAQTELSFLYENIGLTARQYLRPLVESNILGNKL